MAETQKNPPTVAQETGAKAAEPIPVTIAPNKRTSPDLEARRKAFATLRDEQAKANKPKGEDFDVTPVNGVQAVSNLVSLGLPPGAMKQPAFSVPPGTENINITEETEKYWPYRFSVLPADFHTSGMFEEGAKLYYVDESKDWFFLNKEQQSAAWQSANALPQCKLYDVVGGVGKDEKDATEALKTPAVKEQKEAKKSK